jgi:hypothetical protein
MTSINDILDGLTEPQRAAYLQRLGQLQEAAAVEALSDVLVSEKEARVEQLVASLEPMYRQPTKYAAKIKQIEKELNELTSGDWSREAPRLVRG